MRARASALVLLSALLVSTPLGSLDLWVRPFVGVRLLHRTSTNADGNPVELFAALVDLCNPRVSLGATAPSNGGMTVPAWAARVDAALAINADYFNPASHQPVGPARGGGAWWPSAPREHHDDLVLMGAHGAVSLLEAPDLSVPTLWTDAERTVAPEWTDVIAARERILVAGATRLSTVVPRTHDRHPRTALGLSADHHTLILLVVDGRSSRSVGANVTELAATLRALGASDGVKLDGGGSSTLFVRGSGVVNHPSDGHPRAVANHLGVFVSAPAAQDHQPRCVGR